jgi:hypothetical protein
VLDNVVSDTLTEGGGIHVGNRFKSVALSGTTTIARNTIIRGGNNAPTLRFGVGAIWFYALDSAMTGTIAVSDLDIIDSTYAAIQFAGKNVTNVSFDNVRIKGTGTFVVQIQTPGSATFNHVTAEGIGADQPIFSCHGSSFNLIDGEGNSGWNGGKPFCGVMPQPKVP